MSSKSNRVEILILMAGSNRAGQEVLVKELLHEFKQRDVTSFLITYYKGSLFEELSNFYPKNFNPISERKSFQSILILFKILLYIHRIKPAQIHIHGLGFERLLPLIHLMSPKSKRYIVVHNNISSESSPYQQRAKYLIRNKSYITSIVYITKMVRYNFERSLGLVFKNSCIIGNGIKVPEIEYVYRKLDKESTIRLCQVGRLTYQKNHSLAIKVVADLRQRGINVTLDIYGEGPLKDQITKEINELSMDSYISLNGLVNNIQERFLEYDGLIFTSLHEGFPITLIEACMVGIPVFALPCPGITDLFEENSHTSIFMGSEYSQNAMSSMLEEAFLNGIIYSYVDKLRDEFKSAYNIEIVVENYLRRLG